MSAAAEVTAPLTDMVQALSEGWLMCTVDHGCQVLSQIQREDEYEGDDAFESDEDAVAWVRARASEGSEYHAHAIAEHDRDAPIIAAAEQVAREAQDA